MQVYYVSLVDDTLNSNFPCADGSVAAAGADSLHSGVAQGSSSVVTYDTTGMSTAKTFAACYTEGDGTSGASWVDSAIRLTVSKIIFHYGPYSTSFPVRQWLSPNVMPAINRLPQVANAIVTYTGDLATNKYLSIVDSALNSNNPCVDAATAGAGADSTH